MYISSLLLLFCCSPLSCSSGKDADLKFFDSCMQASVHGRADGVSMADGDLKEEPEVHISSFSCGGGGYI